VDDAQNVTREGMVMEGEEKKNRISMRLILPPGFSAQGSREGGKQARGQVTSMRSCAAAGRGSQVSPHFASKFSPPLSPLPLSPTSTPPYLPSLAKN